MPPTKTPPCGEGHDRRRSVESPDGAPGRGAGVGGGDVRGRAAGGCGRDRTLRVGVDAGLLIATFVGSAVKVLQEPWRRAGRRLRAAYVAGVAGCTAPLIVVALAAREVAPLPTMPGTSDVARHRLPRTDGGRAGRVRRPGRLPHRRVAAGWRWDGRNYTSSADAPLDELRADGGSDELDAWVEDFQRETRAELVVAGRAEQGAAGQVAVQTLVYVPARMVYDAAELVGWYVLDDSLLDRSLTSAQTRSTFVGHVTDAFAGLSAFLTGLDAWQAGNAAGAVDALDAAVERAGDGARTLGDLARLFRGHAMETLATGSRVRERVELLAEAAGDYAAMQGRVRGAGACGAERGDQRVPSGTRRGLRRGRRRRARRQQRELAAVADADTVPEIARRKAQVNRAQVESCRVQAGEESADAELDRLLADLTTLQVPEDDDTGELLAQVKALALSIESVRLAGSGRLDDAIDEMGQALTLEPRFERQAIWRALSQRPRCSRTVRSTRARPSRTRPCANSTPPRGRVGSRRRCPRRPRACCS